MKSDKSCLRHTGILQRTGAFDPELWMIHKTSSEMVIGRIFPVKLTLAKDLKVQSAGVLSQIFLIFLALQFLKSGR